jgi:cell wall-associated NlpC family hydrolase
MDRVIFILPYMSLETDKTSTAPSYWKWLILFCLGWWYIRTCNPGTRANDTAQIQESIKSYGEEWLGTPHRLGGSSKSGIDCSGLVQQFYKYAYDVNLPRSSKAMRDEGYKVERGALRAGDLLIFTAEGSSSRINHSGIYLSDGQFLHTSSSKGVIYSNLSEDYWNRNFLEGRRVLGE